MFVVADSQLVKSLCGFCRQAIYELAKNLFVYFFQPSYFNEFNIKDLLMEGFNL